MKKIVVALLIVLPITIIAQNYVLPLWDIGNDNFVEKNKLVFNTSFTSRYNIKDKIQIASNVIVFPLFPNVQAKVKLWSHYKKEQKKSFFTKLKFSLVSVHTLVYPSFGYKILQKYNILPPITDNLPNNLTLQNDLFLSFPTNASKVCHYSGNKITIKAGFRYTFNSDSTLYLPQTAFWFLNTSTFGYKFFYYFGINYDSKIFNNLNLSTSVKFYNIRNKAQILENYTFLYFGFGKKKNSTIAAGYIFDFWGQTKNYTLIPAFNISYKFSNRNKSDMDKYLRIYQ